MWWAQLLNNVVALLGNGAAAAANSFESIATSTVGAGGAASISFNSIVGTYKHLQIRWISRGTSAAAGQNCSIEFNSDTTLSNYRYHDLAGDGTSAIADTNASSNRIFFTSSASSTASAFGAGVIDILDYSNSNKNTTTRVLHGWDANGSGYVILRSNLWMNTAAVTDITIKPQSGNFAQYSSFALYGVK